MATEQEIKEMVRMLDIQGTGKVYFEEFLKMATGKSQSPIGIAYPPSIRLLNKKNLNKMNRKGLIENIADVNKDKAEVSFILDTIAKPDDSLTTQHLKNQGKLSGPEKKKVESRTHQEIIQEFLASNKIALINVIKQLKRKKQREVKISNYLLFKEVIGFEDSDHSRAIFTSLLAPNTTTLAIRQFIVNLSACSEWTPIDKSKWAFSVFDHEDSSYITFDDILNMLAVSIFFDKF